MKIDDITKKVNLTLVGINGNAFSLMGAFSYQAKRDGWTKEEIDTVIKEATSDDYNHLLVTLDRFCELEEDKNYEDI